MYADLVNISLAFFEGFALIISPCILPILPIFLAGSLTGSKKRPLGIIVGFVLVFSLFTFFSRKLVEYSGIDLDLVRQFSYVFLILFGVIMISTFLTDKFANLTRRLTNTGSSLSLANDAQGGLLSGVIFGSLIALIWTPCAGPILATVIVQTVLQETNLAGFFVILAFGLGATIPMLMIVFFGRQIMLRFGYFKKHTGLIRKVLGVIILLSVGYMIYSGNAINSAISATSNPEYVNELQDGLTNPYPAPAIAGIDTWINSPHLTLENLKGKVVLIDFWTYSCINCLRTLPYIKDWYSKYHDKGLVIIGIHAPEFEFEKNIDNVKNAVVKQGIKYPVALDNKFVTWRNYANQYWPAHYLIDKNGNVVYTHFGEGHYDITENNIRYLLGLNKAPIQDAHDNQSSMRQTPETYLGYARAENFRSPETVNKDEVVRYSIPNNLSVDEWALQGKWKIMADRIISDQADAAITINFSAKKVFVVMGNITAKPISVKLVLDGVNVKSIQVDSHTIYPAIELDMQDNHLLKMIASASGLEIYTFTFGN